MNHASFTLFLFFAPIGCMHGLFILVMSLYYGFNVVSAVRVGIRVLIDNIVIIVMNLMIAL